MNLDTDDDGIDCHVLVVSGPVALLQRLSDVPADVRAKLVSGSSCMLAFTHEGALVGLRGIATAASEDLTQLAFVVSDGVQVEERRVAERIPLVTRAMVTEASGDTMIETLTADVSLGGVRIERRPGLGAGPEFRLELCFSGDPAPVRCEAHLARATDTHLGLKLGDLPPDERARFARILADHQLRARPPG